MNSSLLDGHMIGIWEHGLRWYKLLLCLWGISCCLVNVHIYDLVNNVASKCKLPTAIFFFFAKCHLIDMFPTPESLKL